MLLEPLGIDERVHEIDHDHEGHDRTEDVVERHGPLTFFHKRARKPRRRRKSRPRSRSFRYRAWRFCSLQTIRRAAARRNPRPNQSPLKKDRPTLNFETDRSAMK